MCEAASESDSVQRRPLCSAGRVSDFAKPSLVSSRRLSPVHFGEARKLLYTLVKPSLIMRVLHSGSPWTRHRWAQCASPLGHLVRLLQT